MADPRGTDLLRERVSLSLHAAYRFGTIGPRLRFGRMEYGPSTGSWRGVTLLEWRSAVAGMTEP